MAAAEGERKAAVRELDALLPPCGNSGLDAVGAQVLHHQVCADGQAEGSIQVAVKHDGHTHF